MAIIIESSLSGQRKQGNMSVSCFFLLLYFLSFPLSSVLFKLQDTLHVLVAGTVRLGEWNDRPSRRCVGGGIRKMGGSWVPTASGCCCFSSPVSQNIVHARLKREAERDESSSWIEYQRGYLNLGRQITHPQNHHHHLRDQTFKSVCPFLFFVCFSAGDLISVASFIKMMCFLI